MALSRIASTQRRRRLAKKGLSRAERRANSPRPPRAAALAMSRLIQGKLAVLEREVERLLFPVLEEAFAPREERALVVSAAPREDVRTPSFVSNRLRLIELRLAEIFDGRELEDGLDLIGQRVSTKNHTEIRRVVGISIRDADPGVGAQIENFRAINVSRIKSLAGEELVQITNLLERSEATGARVEVLRKAIRERFDVTKSKASLLARDQTLTLNAQIARTRMTNLGIEQYIWTTSGDERVRGNDPNDETDHVSLDGTLQRWDTPPDVGDGRTLHPGEDFQCRCTAFPVLPELA